jgi:hypothetical protein
VTAVSRQYNPDNAGITAVTVIVTAAVFWLAHVYAGVLAVGVDGRHTPTRREARRIVDDEWPLVQSGLLPTVILLLGPLGVVDDYAAQTASLAVCVVELAAIGLLVAKAAGARGFPLLLSGVISTSFGIVIIVLKTAVH